MTKTITTIDFKNAKPTVVAMPPKIILYGRNGIGKSYFASSAPSPIFLDLDENIYELPVISNRTLGVDLKTFEDVLGFMGLLFNEEHEFKTLVIDSLSSLERLITQKVLYDNHVNSLASFKYGQGNLKMIPLWEEFFTKLKKLWKRKSMTILLLGHDRERREETVSGISYTQHQLNLYDKASEILRNWCSCVLFAEDEIELSEESVEFKKKVPKTKNSTRILHTDGGTAFLAKNTYNLPPSLPLNWNVLHNHIQAYYTKLNTSTTTSKGE